MGIFDSNPTQATQAVGVDPQALELQRKRQLANLLTQQALTQQPQGQMVSGHYVAPSWTQNLANLANLYVGQSMQKEADVEQQQLAEKIRQQGEQDIQKYMEAVQGKPAVAPTYDYGNQEADQIATMTTPGQAAVAPDFAKGLSVLRQSKDPENRALAKMLMAERLKSHVLPEGGTIVYGGLGGEGGQISGAPKKTEIQRDYEIAKSQGYPGSFIDYDLMRRTASANKTMVNVQNQLPFKEEVQKEAGKSLMTNFNTLQNIPVQIEQLNKVAQLAPKSFAGSGAQAKLDAAKFLNNNLGLNIAPEKVKNTEELRTVLFTNIMENLKKMDASPSQQQQQVMQESLGNIGTDPAALPKVVNIYKEILVGKAKEHNRRVEEVSKGGMAFPYDIRVRLPEETNWRVKENK